MSHHTQAGRQLTTGSLAVAMVPAMVISAGLTALMAAKACEMIRLANANGKVLEEKAKQAND